MSSPLHRNISPALAFLIIAIFGSVMTMVITRTVDAVVLLEERNALLVQKTGAI